MVPEKGTPEYESMQDFFKHYELNNPDFKKEIKRKHTEAVKTLQLQEANGVDLYLDPELRYYLMEFNHRSWTYGHRKMPTMFNVMEAFFALDKRLNYWTLLEEEDYSMSFFDFIDFYTSKDLSYSTEEIIDSFQEDLIYNFNIQFDLKEINFRTSTGEKFIIAGVSIVRRGNEVTMLFNTGQITDTAKISKKLKPISKENLVKGKEDMDIAEDRILEAVKLDDDPMLWKTLVACRFDLDSNTIDARYIAKDQGNSYSVLTDDITAFVRDGQWKKPEYEKLFKNLVNKVEEYNSIFEFAKACLFLPNYFNFYEADIEEEIIDTRVKDILKGSFRSKGFEDVQNKFKIRNRSLWKLNRNRFNLNGRFMFRDDKYKIETSGYWKEIKESEIGVDKKGEPTRGRTWVQKTESYYVSKSEDLIVEKTNEIKFDDPNSGKIYIMRNSSLPKNVFKIGLTTKTTEERAIQLSNTSIPDKFHVMREWYVKNCYSAEDIIHKSLKKYRVDERREFFMLDMQIANEVIDSVIKEINSTV